MKKWIRWQGLIAFVAVTAAGAAVWLLLADGTIRRAIEVGGTAAVGARVELDSADLSLIPLGLTLEGLRVTNPDEPMANAFEAGRIAFNMDTGRLVMGKVYVKEMQVDAIRLDTPRKTSGAIEKKAEEEATEEKTDDNSSGPKVDIEALVDNEKLDTIVLSERVTREIDERQIYWEDRLKTALPSEAEIKDLEARYRRIKQLSKGGFEDKLIALKDAKKLNRDVKTMRQGIDDATRELRNDIKRLRGDVRVVMDSPRRDLMRLMEKYNLSGQGVENMGARIFGPTVQAYISKARSIYEMAPAYAPPPGEKEKPAPPRHKGVDVRFREHDPVADFSVRLARAALLMEAGEVSGKIENISSDQKVSGIPTTFQFKADGLDGLQALSAVGYMDMTGKKSKETLSEMDLTVKGYDVKDKKLSGSDKLNVVINNAKADLNAKAHIKGKQLSAELTTLVRSAGISAETADNEDKLMRAMAGVLRGIDGFTVKAKATGTLEDYSVKMSTNIDDKLKAAAGSLAREEAHKAEQQLKKAIEDRTKGALAGVNSRFKELSEKESLVKDYKKRLNSML